MFLSLFNVTAFAAESADPTLEAYGITVIDEQIVQVLPEGGFIANADGSSEFDPANVENNKSILMTYAEYKALEKKESSLPYPELSVMTRSASPDRAVNNPKILSANEYYRSADFSGKGWRFSNIKFRAADGTGTWLRWTAIGDGGCVGNEYEAYQTYKSGQAISRKV